jgi:acylphosphatase
VSLGRLAGADRFELDGFILNLAWNDVYITFHGDGQNLLARMALWMRVVNHPEEVVPRQRLDNIREADASSSLEPCILCFVPSNRFP